MADVGTDPILLEVSLRYDTDGEIQMLVLDGPMAPTVSVYADPGDCPGDLFSTALTRYVAMAMTRKGGP